MKVTYKIPQIKKDVRPDYPYLGILKNFESGCFWIKIVLFTSMNSGVCLVDHDPKYSLKGRYDTEWNEMNSFEVFNGEVFLSNKE